GIRGFHVTGVQTCALPIFQTGGMIENRYENKDAIGREKEDFTTGRAELFKAEISAFMANPVAGVGAGRVSSVFKEELGVSIATRSEERRVGKECRHRGAQE